MDKYAEPNEKKRLTCNTCDLSSARIIERNKAQVKDKLTPTIQRQRRFPLHI
jgi:hypothetical protein